MAIKVITGTLESTSPYVQGKDGVNKWQFWRIVDTDGRNHMLKDVRAREFMTSHAADGMEGTFAFSAGVSPIFLGVKYNGQVFDEHEPWRKQLDGWSTVILTTIAIIFVCLGLLYFEIVTGTISAGLLAGFILISPFFLVVYSGRLFDALLTKLPKKFELEAALKTAN